MNEKDHKKIAKMIKKRIIQSTNVNEQWALGELSVLTNELANYYEKELKEQESGFFCADCGGFFTDGESAHLCVEGKRNFNKAQFLKDCGVQK